MRANKFAIDQAKPSMYVLCSFPKESMTDTINAMDHPLQEVVKRTKYKDNEDYSEFTRMSLSSLERALPFQVASLFSTLSIKGLPILPC